MKKGIMTLFFAFIILGMLFNSSVVLAEAGGNPGSGGNPDAISGDDSESNENSGNANLGELEGNRIRERIRNRSNVQKEFNKIITTPSGIRVSIQREVELSNGKVKIKIRKTIVSAGGNGSAVEIEIERNEEGITRQVQINGEDVGVSEELEINDLFEENESELQAVLSNGNTTRIKVLPEQVRERVRERLRTRNISNMSLEQVRYRNIPRVVYNIETNQNGRFLGIFKLALKSETQIDPETGEVLDVNRPWWAFLVSVPEEETTEEVVCCKVEAVVPEPVPEYMLLLESECDDIGDNGEPILGATKTIVENSLCEESS